MKLNCSSDGRLAVCCLAGTGAVAALIVWRYLRNRKPTPSSRTVEVLQAEGCDQYKRENLSFLDFAYAKGQLPLGYKFDCLLDEEILKKGLKDVLRKYPALAGRVDTTSNKNSWMVVLNEPGNCGVEFETIVYEENPFESELPTDKSSLESWLDKDLVRPIGMSEPTRTDPAMKVRLTKFIKEKATFLVLYVQHTIGDASSFAVIMRDWSRACAGEDLGPSQFGQRVCTPTKYVHSKEELVERYNKEVPKGPSLVMCKFAPLSALPIVFRTLMTHKCIELRVVAKLLADVKKDISSKLPEGEWVSTYEVLMSSLIYAANQHRSTQTHKVTFVVNLRTRHPSFQADYFGNGVVFGSPVFQVQTTDTLVELTRRFHKVLRTSLDDPITLYKSSDIRESGRSIGYGEQMRYWNLNGVLSGDITCTNSWTAYPYFCPFQGVMPSCFMSPMNIPFPGMVTQIPRTPTGDSTLFLAVPKSNDSIYDSVPFMERIER